MDARRYFEITDAIAGAKSAEALDALHAVVRTTEMHPLERQALERVLRTRADTLKLSEIVVPLPKPERAD